MRIDFVNVHRSPSPILESFRFTLYKQVMILLIKLRVLVGYSFVDQNNFEILRVQVGRNGRHVGIGRDAVLLLLRNGLSLFREKEIYEQPGGIGVRGILPDGDNTRAPHDRVERHPFDGADPFCLHLLNPVGIDQT